jgi:NAD(P)-dependent dehydrogenase (short-subunit alcohol dehydrogenase family)
MTATQPVLAEQVALVTGAGQGLGLAITRALLEAGAKVAMSDIDSEELTRSRAELDNTGGTTCSLVADLSDPDAAAELPHRAHAAFGRLDIVVNNAGVRFVQPYLDHKPADWQRTLDINLTAPFLICQSAARLMVGQGGGRIVNITSIAAELGFKERSAYNASKAGLTMLTKSIALELGSQGIRCNAIAPGVIETPINSAYLKESELTQIILDGTPVGHWGQPEDIAAAVVFLSGPGADFVNGAVLTVDGGWTAGKGY